MQCEINPMQNITQNSSFLSDHEGELNKNISSILSMLDSPTQSITEDASDTQPLCLLKDVVAYVEVRTGTENRSKAICRELQQMGATVVPKFTNEVTHVIFKDGKKSTCDKARKKNVHLVSVLWVDSCKQNQECVCESLFPGGQPEEKGTPIVVARLKKSKSMQPKDFDEEVASSAEKNVKNRKRMATIAEKALVAAKFKVLDSGDDTTPNRRPMFLVEDTCPRSPMDSFVSVNAKGRSITIPDTPPSMRRKLDKLKARKSLGNDFVPVSDTDSDDQELAEDDIFSKQEEPVIEGKCIKNTPGISAADGMPLQRRLFGSKENSLQNEDPRSAEQHNTSPLVLSAPSSSANNSPVNNTPTSPYIQKLINHQNMKLLSGVSSSTGISPVVSSSSQNNQTVLSDTDSDMNSPLFSKDKMFKKRSNPSALKSAVNNKSAGQFSNKEKVKDASGRNKENNVLVTEGHLMKKNKGKGYVGKKRLLSTTSDRSTQLIAPVNDKTDETPQQEKPQITNKHTCAHRKKVKPNTKIISQNSVRDPSVLFVKDNRKKISDNIYKGIFGKKRKKVSLGEDADDEMGETPLKKSRRANGSIMNKMQHEENPCNALEYNVNKHLNGTELKETLFVYESACDDKQASTKKISNDHGVKKRCSIVEKHSKSRVTQRSSVKITRLNVLDSEGSQPLDAPSIDTPPPVLSHSKDLGSRKSNSLSISATEDDDVSLKDPPNLGSSNSGQLKNRRKSVRFKNTEVKSSSIELNEIKRNSSFGRKSVSKCDVELDIETLLDDDTSPECKIKESKRSKRKSVLQKKGCEKETEPEKESVSNKGVGNLVEYISVAKKESDRRISRQSSLFLQSKQIDSQSNNNKQIENSSPNVRNEAITNIKARKNPRNTLEFHAQTQRRRSSRLSHVVNHNDINTTMECDNTQSVSSFINNTYDSMTDVTALSSQNVSLSPSYRTGHLFNQVHKEKSSHSANHVDETIDESKIESVDANLQNDSVFVPENCNGEEGNNDNVEIKRNKDVSSMGGALPGESVVTEQNSSITSVLQSSTMTNNSTLINLTRTRRSVEEFVNIKNEMNKKSRSTSLPMSKNSVKKSDEKSDGKNRTGSTKTIHDKRKKKKVPTATLR